MGQALYRKYRSKALSEIIGQEHITETLSKAVQTGRISHAYLFTGPRGVGKTSIARILAHEINRLPYTDDNVHMDIIEIDAASNNGVEDIRDLREKVSVAPTSAQYKVYIIDEVHMLSKGAFNALLKTLEEPPAHVVFILATTDAHKLPLTIVSRTQRYTFKPVEQQKVIDHLRVIADAEKIIIDDGALTLLAAHGEGSFRDSISMLDQASGHGKKLTEEDIRILLGIPTEEGITSLISALAARDAPTMAKNLNALFELGYPAVAVAKTLGKTLRRSLLAGSSKIDSVQLLEVLSRLIDVPGSRDPERLLEIILLTASAQAGPAAVPTAAVVEAPVPPAALPAIEKKNISKATSPTPKVAAPAPVTPTPEAPPVVDAAPVQVASIVDSAIWPEVLNALKLKYNTLYGVVRMAVPTFEGNELELAFGFAFHQKRLNDPKNKKILSDILYVLSGQAFHISCVVKKDVPLTNVPLSKPAASAPADLSAIADIFGGVETI